MHWVIQQPAGWNFFVLRCCMSESHPTWSLATAIDKRAKPWASHLKNSCPIQPTFWEVNGGRQQIVNGQFQLALPAVWGVVVSVWQRVAQSVKHSGMSLRKQAGAEGVRRDVVSLTWNQMDTIIQAATKNGNNEDYTWRFRASFYLCEMICNYGSLT